MSAADGVTALMSRVEPTRDGDVVPPHDAIVIERKAMPKTVRNGPKLVGHALVQVHPGRPDVPIISFLTCAILTDLIYLSPID